MSNPLCLISGKKYKVIKPFIDYGQYFHEVGKTWTFVKTNFVPYDDGLTLHVVQENVLEEKAYRCCNGEEKAVIIEHFSDYVALC